MFRSNMITCIFSDQACDGILMTITDSVALLDNSLLYFIFYYDHVCTRMCYSWSTCLIKIFFNYHAKISVNSATSESTNSSSYIHHSTGLAVHTAAFQDCVVRAP